jgi:hypothetical protein
MLVKKEPQLIDIRTASGGWEYTWPLTISEESLPIAPFNGPKDISADTIKLSLGTSSAPGAWRTPDVDHATQDAAGAAKGVMNQRVVQMMVGVVFKPPDNIYWLWSQVGDSPESVIRKHCKIIVRADS